MVTCPYSKEMTGYRAGNTCRPAIYGTERQCFLFPQFPLTPARSRTSTGSRKPLGIKPGGHCGTRYVIISFELRVFSITACLIPREASHFNLQGTAAKLCDKLASCCRKTEQLGPNILNITKICGTSSMFLFPVRKSKLLLLRATRSRLSGSNR